MLAVKLNFLVVSLLLGGVTPSPKPFYDMENAENHFETFMNTYGKQYTCSDEEKNRRFEIFKKNLEDINRKNRDPNQDAVFGITQFSDLTTEEFLKKYTGLIIPEEPVGPYFNLSKHAEAPANFDWREKGVITRVKNQGSPCGSCWTFSATGAVESAYAIKTGQLRELSEQQILDCDRNGRGCAGGLPQHAINYIVQTGGQEGERSYPYEGRQGRCRFDRRKVEVRAARMLPYYLNNEQTTIQYLLQTGPIAIALDASEFINYRGGVFSCRGTRLNHAVLLVGYGQERGQPYYLIKNSYGEQFGERGYIKVHRLYNCGLHNQYAAGAQIA